MECKEAHELYDVQSSQEADVAVAVGKGNSSHQALKWTLQTLIRCDNRTLHLLHVQNPLFVIQTPLGYLPFDQANEECQKHAKQQQLSATRKILQTYQRMCEKEKVNVKVHCMESSSISQAIVEQVSKLRFVKLVLGSSSKLKLRKLLKGSQTAATVAENVPDFCAVMVVRNERLLSVKAAEKSVFSIHSPSIFNITDTRSTYSAKDKVSDGSACLSSKKNSVDVMLSPRTSCSLSCGASSLTEMNFNCGTKNCLDHYDDSQSSEFQWSNTHQRLSSMKKIQVTFKDLRALSGSCHQPSLIQSEDLASGAAKERKFKPELLDITCSLHGPQQVSDVAETHGAERGLNQGSILMKSLACPPCNDNDLTCHVRRYDNPQHNFLSEPTSTHAPAFNIYRGDKNVQSSQHDCKDFSKQTSEILCFEKLEGLKSTLIQELKDELCVPLQVALKVREENAVIEERKKCEDLVSALSKAKGEMEFLKAELDTAKQQAAMDRSSREEALVTAKKLERELVREAELRKLAEKRSWKAKKDLMKLLREIQRDLVELSFEELQLATKNFSEDNKVGEGGYGGVYKGVLNHETVAVKVLQKGGKDGEQQFQHEAEVLSSICHPHIVNLIGACKEKPCIVYEFMENGSLEDRLLCKDGTPPLAWHVRFKICFEIVLALVFLHNLKPNPVVHRDLKPGNILLDKGFVSKLSDAGLARWIPKDMTYDYTEYRETRPAGTFPYMDPEYVRTGTYGPHSDVFALGIVFLQLLTSKPPLGVVNLVEKAIEENRLHEILDPSAGEWPLTQAEELAKLGVLCAESKRRDRPKLDTYVLGVAKKLHDTAQNVAATSPNTYMNGQIPHSFICPLSQKIMTAPHTAADGFNYEYAAIKNWTEQLDISPMTNLKLAHKQLKRDGSLESKIELWNQGLNCLESLQNFSATYANVSQD